VNEQGGVIQFDVETEQPLEIEARFTADFTLAWPAGLGGTYVYWNESQHAFVFGEESRRFAALVGSPTAGDPHVAYQTNYSSAEENSVRLGVTSKGKESKLLVFAGSSQGLATAESTYQKLITTFPSLLRDSANYYQEYLRRTVNVTLPDSSL